ARGPGPAGDAPAPRPAPALPAPVPLDLAGAEPAGGDGDGYAGGGAGHHRGGQRGPARGRRGLHPGGDPAGGGPVAAGGPAGGGAPGRRGPPVRPDRLRPRPVPRRLGPPAGGGEMRIAVISEHASPLADPGDEAAGGQNVHVAQLAAALAAHGHEVRVYTRRYTPEQPTQRRVPAGYTVVHVPVGPAAPVARDELLPYMKDFGHWLAATWREGGWRPEVVHAHYWMSGVAAVIARRRVDTPIVQTYHALGTVKRRYQGAADTSPRERNGY